MNGQTICIEKMLQLADEDIEVVQHVFDCSAQSVGDEAILIARVLFDKIANLNRIFADCQNLRNLL